MKSNLLPLVLAIVLILSNDVPIFQTFASLTKARFNWAARKLHKRLVQLGANELYPRGEADEQHEEG